MQYLDFFWQYVDFFCERTRAGFFDEPLNLISNLPLIWVAFVIQRNIKEAKITDKTISFLRILVYVIILGSFAFHSTAMQWGRFLDLVPIALFYLIHAYVVARRILRLSRWSIFLQVLTFCLVAVLYRRYIEPDGNLLYPPFSGAIALSVIHAVLCFRKGVPCAYMIAVLGLLACLGFLLMKLDIALCDLIPIGLHWLWHIVAAVILYFAFLFIIKNPISLPLHPK